MKLEDIKKIAVIGSGAMGHGIAQVCAASGFTVVMNDIRQEFLDSAMARVRESLDILVGKGRMTADECSRIMTGGLTATLSMAEAVRGAQVIIEAVPEVMDLKMEVFAALSGLADDGAILATNTSTMSVSDISRSVKDPSRFAGMHFFNPVSRMKLVEVVYGESTSHETVNTICELSAKCEKFPVRVLKDRPGFIVNRVNAPNQALLSAILDEGKIMPCQVDMKFKKIGVKMAPFETADFVGLDVFCHTLDYYAATLSPQYRPGRYLEDLVKRHALGMKSGQGIYTWVDGKAQIADNGDTDAITPIHFMAVQVNEAVKVMKEGIAGSVKNVDDAVKFGMNAFAGPFALAAGMQPMQLADALNYLADRFSLDILRPEPEITGGAYRDMK